MRCKFLARLAPCAASPALSGGGDGDGGDGDDGDGDSDDGGESGRGGCGLCSVAVGLELSSSGLEVYSLWHAQCEGNCMIQKPTKMINYTVTVSSMYIIIYTYLRATKSYSLPEPASSVVSLPMSCSGSGQLPAPGPRRAGTAITVSRLHTALSSALRASMWSRAQASWEWREATEERAVWWAWVKDWRAVCLLVSE